MGERLKHPDLSAGTRVSIGDKYGYAMEITDEKEAAEYFEKCVRHNLSFGECERPRAEEVERANLGYYAGYYDNETRQRVERLFNCSHPIFGKATEAPVDPGKALLTGMAIGETDLKTATRVGYGH